MGMTMISVTFAILVFAIFRTSESRGVAGNINLVMINNNQYWFSSSTPFAPSLNFFLAYEYCRNLGLQLVTLDTKDEIHYIGKYLRAEEATLGMKDYWTSGNKLGTDIWLWMSTGEQLNSTFVTENGLQHRQNIPSISKQCITLRSHSTGRAIFTPEVCEKSLPFICEQIRCLSYYYPTTVFPDPGETEFSSGHRSDELEGEENGNGTNKVARRGLASV